MKETREGRAAEVVVVAVGAAEASGIAGAVTIRVVMSGGSRGAEVREVVVEAKEGTGAGAAVGEVVVEAKEGEVVAEAAEASGIADAVTIRVVMSGGAEASGITDAKTLLVMSERSCGRGRGRSATMASSRRC